MDGIRDKFEEDFSEDLPIYAVQQSLEEALDEPKPFSDEELEIKKQFDLGLRLRETTNSAGWQDILDIMERKCLAVENELIHYDGVEDKNILALQRRAHAFRTFFTFVQRQVNDLIAASLAFANSTPQTVIEDPNYQPGF
jgi:hypothetical protein